MWLLWVFKLNCGFRAMSPSFPTTLTNLCYNSVALTIVPYDQIIHHCKTILRLIGFYIPVWQNNLELWKLWSHSLWAVSRFLVYENFMSLYENFMSLYEKFMGLYENFMSLYENFMSLYENFMSLYEKN